MNSVETALRLERNVGGSCKHLKLLHVDSSALIKPDFVFARKGGNCHDSGKRAREIISAISVN